MKYRMTVLDLDGTLTNSKKEITQRTKRTLRRFMRSGGIVVLASGRPSYGVMPLAQELDLRSYGGYILAYNGGLILDCREEKVLYQKSFEFEVTEKIYGLALKNRVSILTYQNNLILTETPEDPYVQKEAWINHMSVQRVDHFTEAINFPVTKFLMTGEDGYLEKVEQRVKKELDGGFSILRSEPYFLEIMPEGIDKAKSLDRLLAILGMKRTQMAAFGDGFNDKSMIESAGFGVAMRNGQAIVKAAADFIAPSNDEDGVAQVMEAYIL